MTFSFVADGKRTKFVAVNQLNGRIMARPIKETPILYGKDAERFVRDMKNVKPASEEERKRVRTSYEKIKKIATFMM